MKDYDQISEQVLLVEQDERCNKIGQTASKEDGVNQESCGDVNA